MVNTIPIRVTCCNSTVDTVSYTHLDVYKRQSPSWTKHRAVLWDEAEKAERRKNSVVAREVLIALPHELSKADRIALTRALASWLVSRYGVAAVSYTHLDVYKRQF